jgi:hypothetical protein
MATGRLATPTAILASQSPPQTVYTVPTGYYTVLNVSITNRNTAAVKIRLAMSTSGTPNAQEWLEYDTTIVPNGVFERTGLVMQAGLNLIVYSDTANLGCTVYGIETATS